MSLNEEQAQRPRARNAKPKIERAALQLFVDEGIDAATTREIAEVAGVSEGALYRHYKGKDELALSLFMTLHNRLSDMVIQAATADGSMEDKVRGIVSAYCSLADEDWLLFSFHLVSINRYIPYDTRRDDDPVTLTSALIDGLMAAGEIPTGNTELLAAMSLGVISQAGQNKVYGRLPGPFSDHIDAFTRAICAILRQV